MKIVLILAAALMVFVASAVQEQRTLFDAINSGDLAEIRQMTSKKEYIDARDANNYTPLMVAAKQASADVVKVLVESGADIDATDTGFTVVDQVEGYLRRTGENKRRTIEMMKRDGFSKQLIESVEKDAATLNESPEQIQRWQTILAYLKKTKTLKDKLDTEREKSPGVLPMCVAVAHRDTASYYLAIASAGKLLYAQPGTTISITVMPTVHKQDGMQRRDFVINGISLSALLTNGIITKLVQDGRDIGIKAPEPLTNGDAAWRKLSKLYHDRMLQKLSFTSFFGNNEPSEVQEVLLTATHKTDAYFLISSETTGKMRMFGYSDDRPVTCINQNDIKSRQSDLNVAFGDMARVDSGNYIHYSGKGFVANFFPHGGLSYLYLWEPDGSREISVQQWNKEGKLIEERDLIKNPHPPENPFRGMIMLKGGREI